MCTSINKIIITFGLLLFVAHANALDTTKEENTCAYIGFKKGTESFGNCVLELIDRNKKAASKNVTTPTQTVKVITTKPEPQAVGDGSVDDSTCQKYGFKPRSNEYASCRLQIDQAKQDAQRQEAQFAEQQKQYEAQLEEQKRQRKIASGIALMQMGAGLSSGAYNANNAYGALPTPPNPNRTYVLPGGKMMNCTTTGSVTQCF